MRFRPCFLGALLLASGVHSGQAQTPSTFSLEYAAPALCPDKARFVEAIVARAPQAREVAPEAARFRFVAYLEGSGAPGKLARGSVSVEQQDRSISRRDVAEAPCTEVVESMAVILSLILAGGESAPALSPVAPTALAPAGAAPSPAPEQGPAPAPPTEPPADADAQPPAPPAPAPAPAPAPKEPHQPAASPAAPAQAPAPSGAPNRWRAGIRLAGVAETGVAPSLAFGGQGGLDLWWARSDFWSPSGRLTARYVRSGLAETDTGSARFRLVALRAELCPVRWPTRSSTFGRVCALFDAGQLEAEPQDDVEGEALIQTMPWIGGGGSLRLETTLADTVSLEAAADLVALGRADTFILQSEPQTTVHEVPRITALFSLGAVVRLP